MVGCPWSCQFYSASPAKITRAGPEVGVHSGGSHRVVVHAGRVFFVCNRNAGKLPEGRCDFFQWEGDRQMRGGKAQASGKGVTLKGC